jgi:hypothetical protein
VAIAVEAKRDSVLREQLLQQTKVADGVFRLELEMRGEHATGGVVL